MKTKSAHPVIVGTLLLTITGLVVRLIGFFYRIYLSNIIGAESMGIYQLIAPVHMICFALCSGSIQTAISKFVAQEALINDPGKKRSIFLSGLFLSVGLSLILAALIYIFSEPLAANFLLEERCSPLLKILALSVPLSAAHACINGYYYGLKKANVPAYSQLVEQILRVVSVVIIVTVMSNAHTEIDAGVAVYGLAIGEAAALLFSLICFSYQIAKEKRGPITNGAHTFWYDLKRIILYSLPLTANRLVLSVLQSAEAVLIPGCLQLYGLTSSESLSVYGVLTGMAMPFIMFPTAITNSLSVMLLPDISEAEGADNHDRISFTSSRTVEYCIYIGILCTGIFLMFGEDMGTYIFGDSSAGRYIMILSWLCPFLYLASTTASILNGMGKAATTFIHSLLGLVIRLIFVVFLIPKMGINAYLYGALISQLLTTFLHLFSLSKLTDLHFNAGHKLMRPICAFALAFWITSAVKNTVLESLDVIPVVGVMVIAMCLLCLIYIGLLFITREKKRGSYV